MEINKLIPHIEALIFATEKAITIVEISEIISGISEEPVETEKIESSIEAIKEKYATEYFPFELSETGGGYQFLTKKTYHQTILQLNGDKHIKKLSTAAMETLAIIAYRQPITKAEIEHIRGVSSDYSVQKLLEKELIVIAGRDEEAIGKPLIYTTSKNFMDYLGINTPGELPQLKEIFNTEIVLPVDAENATPDDMTTNTNIIPFQPVSPMGNTAELN